MALYPKPYGLYDLANIDRNAIKKNGKEVYRGFGSDYTDETDNFIYFHSPPLARTIVLKAFIDNFKINFTKETEMGGDQDKSSNVYVEYTTNFSYDVELNIPAHSVNESVNNLAKITELQRLISPIKGGTTKSYKSKVGYMSVWFKNLISSGLTYPSFLKSSVVNSETLNKFGFICYLDNVSYEPDLEAGFFEFNDQNSRSKNSSFLYPRNIKLKLKLNYGVEEFTEENKGSNKNSKLSRPFYGYNSNGTYNASDNGGFLFGLPIQTKGYEESLGDTQALGLYSDEVNAIDDLSLRESTIVFISNQIREDREGGSSTVTTAKRKRWALFTPMIDSFSSNYMLKHKIVTDNKAKVFGNRLDLSSESTFGGIEYSLKINMPARSILEAKKNCAKVQIISRLFIRETITNEASKDALKEFERTRNKVKVYVPTMIEKPGAANFRTTSFNEMFDNAMDLYFTNIDIDIDGDMGFFEENDKLFPKAMSVDLKFVSNDPGLIKNYSYERQNRENLYKMDSIGSVQGSEHLFPYNRQTSKIILGQ